MNDLAQRILGDGVVVVAVGGIVLFGIRRIIVTTVERHSKKIADLTAAVLELERRRADHIQENTKFIFPEIIEVVYRLRNEFRSIIESARESLLAVNAERRSQNSIREFGGDLFALTNRLYSYRAWLSNDDFQKLHTFKRRLQDAQVLLNRITRTETIFDMSIREEWDDAPLYDSTMARLKLASESSFVRLEESIGRLEENYAVADKLHAEIIESIRVHLRSSLLDEGKSTVK